MAINLTNKQPLYDELLNHNILIANDTGSMSLQRIERSSQQKLFKIHETKSSKELSLIDRFSTFVNKLARTQGPSKSSSQSWILTIIEWFIIIIVLVIFILVSAYCSCIIRVLMLPLKIVKEPLIGWFKKRVDRKTELKNDIFF